MWTKEDERDLLLQMEAWIRSRLEHGGAHAQIELNPVRAYLSRLDRVRLDLATQSQPASVHVSLSDDPVHDQMVADFLKKHRHSVDTTEAYDDLRQLLASAGKLDELKGDYIIRIDCRLSPSVYFYTKDHTWARAKSQAMHFSSEKAGRDHIEFYEKHNKHRFVSLCFDETLRVVPADVP